MNAPLPFNWLKAVCKASMAELDNAEPVILRTDKVLAGAVAFPVRALLKRPGVNAAAEKLSLAADVLTPAWASMSSKSETFMLALALTASVPVRVPIATLADKRPAPVALWSPALSAGLRVAWPLPKVKVLSPVLGARPLVGKCDKGFKAVPKVLLVSMAALVGVSELALALALKVSVANDATLVVRVRPADVELLVKAAGKPLPGFKATGFM